MVHSISEPLAIDRAVARSLGEQAAIYGYPMVEMLRMCRLQTRARFDCARFGPAPIDTLRHTAIAPHGHADVLCSTGWIYLAEGARRLTIPAVAENGDAPALVSLYDAYGERFIHAERGASTQQIVLLGPHAAAPSSSRAVAVVCPTSLVWLVGLSPLRADIDGESARGASLLQLDGPHGTLNGLRPAAVEMWEGDETDAFSELIECQRPARDTAPAFYANFCRALAHASGRCDERHFMARLRQVGLKPADAFDWHGLCPQIRQSLVEGFEDAAIAVCDRAAARSDGDIDADGRADAGTRSAATGRGRADYLARAAAVRSGAVFGMARRAYSQRLAHAPADRRRDP